MSVYVEYVFINNLITDYALLSSALLLRGKPKKRTRLIFTSIIGAILAVFIPFVSDEILPLYKIFVGVLMSILSIKNDRFNEYVKTFITLFLFTCFIGGVLIAVASLFHIENYDAVYLPLQFIPVGVIVAFSTIVFIRQKNKANVNKFVYDCVILIGKKSIECKGFLDTGNRVFLDNVPVVICSDKISNIINLEQNHMVTYSLNLTTVAGVTTVKALKNVDILIYFSDEKHIHKKVVLALSDGAFISDVILHPSLIS